MNTIWKFPLVIEDAVVVEMPAGSRILSVQVQRDEPCLWAVVDSTAPRVKHRILIRGTGHPLLIDMASCPFIGTFQIPSLGLVFHVFDGGEV